MLQGASREECARVSAMRTDPVGFMADKCLSSKALYDPICR